MALRGDGARPPKASEEAQADKALRPTDIDAARYEIAPSLIALVPGGLAHRYEVIPIDKVGQSLMVGAVSPLNGEALQELESVTDLQVRPVLCAAEDVQDAIARYYPTRQSEGDAQRRAGRSRGPFKLPHVARLIRQIDALPALPETVGRLREAMANPESSIDAVVEIITLDPPVAAKVLSVANSAAYGFSQRIHDIGLAVSLLGLRETYAIVLSVAVADFVKKLKHVDYRSFWLDAVCCAAASRIVAKASRRRQLSGVFAAGLLHDIGRAVLWEVVPELSERIDPKLTNLDLVAAEQRGAGLSHAEAGYQLAVHWNLPIEIAEPVRFHHAPDKASVVREHVAVVALAHVMAAATGSGLDENADLFNGHEQTLAFLGLDAEDTEAMVDEYLTKRSNAVREAFN